MIESDELRSLEPVQRLEGRNSTKATLLFYRHGDQRIAVKDYGARSFLIRQLLGRLMIRWETAAYRAGEGIPGLPRFLGRLGSFSLATEWVDARPLSKFPAASLRTAHFDAARRTLDELHARGIAMADLHRADVLVSDDGAVYFVDLATAWLLGERPGRFRRMLFRHFSEQDRLALARMRAYYCGLDPEAALNEAGPRAAARFRRGRRIKRFVERLRGRRG